MTRMAGAPDMHGTTTLATPAGDIAILVLRDCFGGDRVVEVELPEPLAEEDLARLPGAGKPTVLRSAPRPFFRLEVPGAFLLSGVFGDRRVRFTVRLARRDDALQLVADAAARLLEAP
jgi:hypothetical protein